MQNWWPVKVGQFFIGHPVSQIVKSDGPNDHLTDLLLYGSESFNDVSNSLILNETINFIFQSERFKTLEAYS